MSPSRQGFFPNPETVNYILGTKKKLTVDVFEKNVTMKKVAKERITVLIHTGEMPKLGCVGFIYTGCL